MSLFNDIKLLAQSILYSPLESIDLKILTEPFGRFQDLQVIRERAGNLIADGWKSVEMLIWDCNDELMKYIQLENGKGSLDALEGCIKRVKLLGSIFKCQDAEQMASTNVLEFGDKSLVKPCFSIGSCIIRQERINSVIWSSELVKLCDISV